MSYFICWSFSRRFSRILVQLSKIVLSWLAWPVMAIAQLAVLWERCGDLLSGKRWLVGRRKVWSIALVQDLIAWFFSSCYSFLLWELFLPLGGVFHLSIVLSADVFTPRFYCGAGNLVDALIELLQGKIPFIVWSQRFKIRLNEAVLNLILTSIDICWFLPASILDLRTLILDTYLFSRLFDFRMVALIQLYKLHSNAEIWIVPAVQRWPIHLSVKLSSIDVDLHTLKCILKSTYLGLKLLSVSFEALVADWHLEEDVLKFVEHNFRVGLTKSSVVESEELDDREVDLGKLCFR